MLMCCRFGSVEEFVLAMGHNVNSSKLNKTCKTDLKLLI